MKPSPRSQSGATLVVGLIMLVLITLVVTSAFMLSTTNLKSVGNMQFRDEATAAANKALEQIVGSSFATSPTSVPHSINVDINQDGTTDYEVIIATPTCISGSLVTWSSSNAGKHSSSELENLQTGSNTYLTTTSYYNTVWDIDATVTDTISGASIHVHQGIRAAPMTAAQFATACP